MHLYLFPCGSYFHIGRDICSDRCLYGSFPSGRVGAALLRSWARAGGLQRPAVHTSHSPPQSHCCCGAAPGKAAFDSSQGGRDGWMGGWMLPGRGRRSSGPAVRRRGEGVPKIRALRVGFALPTPGAGRGWMGTVWGAGLDPRGWVVPELGTAASAAREVILGCRF